LGLKQQAGGLHTKNPLFIEWNFFIPFAQERLSDLGADNRLPLPYPNVFESNWIAVILQRDGPLLCMLLVLRRAIEWCIPL
jgi:hypothetical protein